MQNKLEICSFDCRESQSCIHMTKKIMFLDWTKHIDIMHHSKETSSRNLRRARNSGGSSYGLRCGRYDYLFSTLSIKLEHCLVMRQMATLIENWSLLVSIQLRYQREIREECLRLIR